MLLKPHRLSFLLANGEALLLTTATARCSLAILAYIPDVADLRQVLGIRVRFAGRYSTHIFLSFALNVAQVRVSCTVLGVLFTFSTHLWIPYVIMSVGTNNIIVLKPLHVPTLWS